MKQILSKLKQIWESPDDALEEGKVEPKESRKGQRQTHCLRVVSTHLPGLRALTVDISPSGLQIETFAPIAVGQKMSIEVETGLFPLKLDAEVKWCEAITEGIYHVGLCLQNSRPHCLTAYRKWVRAEIEYHKAEVA